MSKKRKGLLHKKPGGIRVCAIDPGYARLGIAVLEKNEGQEVLLFSGCIVTPNSKLFEERLVLIGNEINRLLDIYKPDAIAVETLFLTKNQKTVMYVAGVRGVIAYIAAQRKISLYEYSPPQIKVAVTGYGKSDKKQVMSMVRQLITVSKKKAFDDEYDAIAVGLTCFAIEKTLK